MPPHCPFGDGLSLRLGHAAALRAAHILHSPTDADLTHSSGGGVHILLRHLQHFLRCAALFQAAGGGCQPLRAAAALDFGREAPALRAGVEALAAGQWDFGPAAGSGGLVLGAAVGGSLWHRQILSVNG